MKRVLITGGAGLIGSHTADLMLRNGYAVRIFDNLEYPTHLRGVPDYLPKEAEFIRGDVRNVDQLRQALRDVQVVIHLAATGGFTSDLARYFQNNTMGTVNLLTLLRTSSTNVDRLVVASSCGIYGEGLYESPTEGAFGGVMRPIEQLERGTWEMHCPISAQPSKPLPTPEWKEPRPGNAYCISKFDQERLVLSFGRSHEISTCALRYFVTYGPRQSLTNPYTGIIAIFASRLMNGLPPVLYEDGQQMRDFVYVGDVARANLLAVESDSFNDRVLNVASGQAVSVCEAARAVAQILGKPGLGSEVPGSYRLGEARHMMADITEIRDLGFEPQTAFHEGLKITLEWLVEHSDSQDYFGESMERQQRQGVVRSITAQTSALPMSNNTIAEEHSLSVVVPAFNEEGNVEKMLRDVLEIAPQFTSNLEVIVVNDGSQDRTREIVEALAQDDSRVRLLNHPFNMGYGAAQKTGFEAATQNWVALVPADNQFDIRDLARYFELTNEADIVGGIRIARKEGWNRRFVSGLFNTYMRTAHDVQLTDLNWVKLFRRSVLQQIAIECPGFAADAEILVKAARLGARFAELEVEHYPRTWGEETTVSFRNVYHTAKEIIRFPSIIRRGQMGRDDRQDG